MADVGAIITPPGQYTHCVDRKDYQDIPGLAPWDSAVPTTAGFILCNYLLGGKLVCLAGGGDECAIGIVAGLEPVGAGKSGFDKIDNDFSFNVLLAPLVPQDFASYGPLLGTPPADPHAIRDDAVQAPLGWLMRDSVQPTTLKRPREPSSYSPVDGYGVPWTFKAGALIPPGVGEGLGDNLYKLGSTTDVALPVIHAECEGSRIFFVCQAMHPFIEALSGQLPGTDFSPGSACRNVAKHLPWPIDKIVTTICNIVEDLVSIPIALALAPAMAAAFATAWAAAQAYDDLFVTGPVAKQIHIGDVVIVQGRWVWDAGHAGHTEIHPVKLILKLTKPPSSRSPNWLPPQIRPSSVADYNPQHLDQTGPGTVSAAAADIKATHERWCRLVSEAPPPPDPRQPGGILSPPQLASLTPAQTAVWQAQNRPENSWTVHPLIDGCSPAPGPDTGPGGLH
jgi:hypothetical protein